MFFSAEKQVHFPRIAFGKRHQNTSLCIFIELLGFKSHKNHREACQRWGNSIWEVMRPRYRGTTERFRQGIPAGQQRPICFLQIYSGQIRYPAQHCSLVLSNFRPKILQHTQRGIAIRYKPNFFYPKRNKVLFTGLYFELFFIALKDTFPFQHI